MLQRTVRTVKNEKGLTLIELLAVVVILGIIALIAIPAIGGLIDNSKKDAHVANAVQMINSAKLAVVGDETVRPAAGANTTITLKWLEDEGYLEPVKDPDGGDYSPEGSFVTVTGDSTGKKLTYSVTLTNGTRGISADEENVKRSEVK